MRQLIGLISFFTLFFTLFQPAAYSEAIEQAKEYSIEVAQAGKTPPLSEILDKYYVAIGGEKTWNNIDSLLMTGNMKSLGTEFDMKAVYVRPDKCRLDFTRENISFIESHDGQVTWHKNPFVGGNTPSELTGPRATEVKETCEFDSPLINYKEQGHKIEFIGKEKDGDRESYNLKVTFKSGNIDNYFLDTETYLPRKIVGTTTVQGQKRQSLTILSDYIETGDIVLPYKYVFKIEGLDTDESFKVYTVEINPKVDETLFRMPRDIKDSR